MQVPEVYQKYLEYLPYFLQGLFFTLFLTPLVGKLGWKLKILDLPPSMRKLSEDRDRHLEKPPVPQTGGIAVFTTFLLLVLLNRSISREVLWILLPATILHIGGILDTLKNYSYNKQLTFQLLAILIFLLSPVNVDRIHLPGTEIFIHLDAYSIDFSFFQIPISFLLPGDLLIGLWIFLMINAFKLNAGTDALAEGNLTISSLIVFLISIRFGGELSAVLSIIFSGAMLGYAIYNFYPGKIHSGSSGKSVYGFIIATTAIISGSKLAATFMAAALPFIDMIFVIAQRAIKHKSLNLKVIAKGGDQNHLHHKLLKMGLSEAQVALIEYGITLTIGLVAAFISGLMKFVLILLLPIALAGFILWATLRPKKVEKL